MKTAIKIIMVILLLGCLAKMPYGYFQFIRIACCAGFIYLAVEELKAQRHITGILSIAGAILFNPIFKVYLGRSRWNTVDVILAILLLVWVIVDYFLRNKQQLANNRQVNDSKKRNN